LKKDYWLIIEPTFIGHHYIYLENIIEQALNRNIDLIIATQNNTDGVKIKEKIQNNFTNPPNIILFGEMHEIKNKINIFSLILHELNVRNYYSKIYKNVSSKYKISHVFIPYLDDFIFAVSLFKSPFGKTFFSGITMRQQFHLISNIKSLSHYFILIIKKHLFINFIKNKNLSKLFIIDPKLKELINKEFPKIKEKVIYFGDPVNTLHIVNKSLARKNLTIPNDDIVILLYGYIDERKGVYNLINWAEKNNKKLNLTLLIVGTQNNEIKNYFKFHNTPSGINLIIKDQFVTNQEEGLYFSASDLVWIAYNDFYLMSSVLIKSAQAKIPIIHYDFGLISYFAKKYGTSITSNSEIFDKDILFDDHLCVTSFNNSKHNFVIEHTWNNAGNLFFNS
jgi:hypothetical protein